MRNLWTPPTRENLQAREEYRRDLLEQARRDATLDFWTRELKEIDPYLELIQAREDSTLMRPGFYYVLRHNPGAPPSLLCVEGPDGEFVEPNSGLFEKLRSSDMWNAEAERDRKERVRKAEEAETRRKERESEDRVQEMAERWQAVTRTQVSMNRSSKWTQSMNGRRG
jgi:hypothetical protein